MFATLFAKKVKVSSSFTPMLIQKAPPPTLMSDGLTHFGSLSSGDVYTLDISHDILPFLTTLINSSFTSSLIPAPFKTATVKPLLKKPTLDSADIRNYRHVSLLSFHAVANQNSPLLSQNNLLDPNQSGFRTAHSTVMALLTLTMSLCAARAWSHSSVLILLHLSYTFDTVNHQILLSTLVELGIANFDLTWFTSYLT